MITEKELSTEYAAKLIFNSFNFSQGSWVMQRRFFSYFHEIHPEWRIISHKQEEMIKKALLRPILMRTASHIHEEVARIYLIDQISKEVTYFRKTLNGEPDSYKYSYKTDWIAKEFALQDYMFLCEKGGRSRLNPDPEVFAKDPFASYFRRYILEQNTENLEEIN